MTTFVARYDSDGWLEHASCSPTHLGALEFQLAKEAQEPRTPPLPDGVADMLQAGKDGTQGLWRVLSAPCGDKLPPELFTLPGVYTGEND